LRDLHSTYEFRIDELVLQRDESTRAAAKADDGAKQLQEKLDELTKAKQALQQRLDKVRCQHATYRIRTPCNMQSSAYDMHHAAYDMHHAAYDMHHAARQRCGFGYVTAALRCAVG
jgi:phage gp16-like protein